MQVDGSFQIQSNVMFLQSRVVTLYIIHWKSQYPVSSELTTNQDRGDDECLVAEAVDQLGVGLGEVAREVGAVALAPGADLGQALLLQLDYVQLKVGPETLQSHSVHGMSPKCYLWTDKSTLRSWPNLSKCI